ncbi:thiamine pyrophosphate-binding protein [Roseicitreum antarcticum]|uniref:Acetolactate synthase large subunit n=1 Tax=Roseicitreum antarcticum TaxID=564137 RepID=A0A1H2W351_9RHOB|nr:thiamine pyrophosphate-binding protein [Roseicitreum antarcticum]SDW74539.1 Acetolactate synthase large subunit [Roseicitreum antarcticum]
MNGPAKIPVEQPDLAVAGPARFGSDVIAQTLRDIGFPYLAMNPGASFRGLHDSIVNYLGNETPKLLLCLHEEHAVAIAHGYAKVTDRPIAAAVHSNVGLMHASMAIFNAWCDRAPVVVLGATGPVDAAQRRPWIDWIHTAADQGALVRNFVKWDNQPASAAAAREAVLRATWISDTTPKGPVYVNLDATVQESLLEGAASDNTPAQRYLTTARAGPAADTMTELAVVLRQARNPVILAGRNTRDEAAWQARVDLAERLGAGVITDIRIAAAFPTSHGLYLGDLRGNAQGTRAALAQADLIIALDWVDLGGVLSMIPESEVPARVVRVGLDHAIHNGWSMDHQSHPATDYVVACDAAAFTNACLAALGPDGNARRAADAKRPTVSARRPRPPATGPLSVADIAQTLADVVGDIPVSLTHVPLSWQGADWDFNHPLDFLGGDGGGGIGAGPGLAVGAALALRDTQSPRLPVAVCGDGDFLMGCTALWTAVHYDIPLLMIVANNRSFYNDEVHQERIARLRGRPVQNKWIGMRMRNPDIDLTGIAKAQGCMTFGPAATQGELAIALDTALAHVRGGGVGFVEVLIDTGYPDSLTSSIAPASAVDGSV